MPQSLRTPPGVPGQALKNFTNREKEKDIIKRVLNTPIGHPLPVVMFYGVGGAGKSWLLKKLREEHPQLPSAWTDLDPRTGPSSDPSKLLAAIRSQFKDTACPRFDTAYAWLRHKEGIGDEPALKGSGAVGEAFETVKEFVGSAAGTPLVGPLLKRVGQVVKKQFDESKLEKWLAEQAGQEDFLWLRTADTQEIYPQLPRRLLQDLAENLKPVWVSTQCKGVIFLDTMEALSVGLPGSAQRHERAAWVRNLDAADSPVLLVLAGRDRLTWDEIDADYAKRECLEQHLVGGLSEGDARIFLGKCGITDPPLQDAILRVSEDTESEPEDGERGYHPFSLGLCADTVYVEAVVGRSTDPHTFDMPAKDIAELAQRFLKSLPTDADQNWVKLLALTPRFDQEAAMAAREAVEGNVSKSAWQTLLGFSFVQDADEPGWWTLHAKMRDALVSGSHTADGNGWWAGYWRQRSSSESDDFAGLSWFHDWCVTPVKASLDWFALAKKLRGREMRMREHFAVLEWWEPTGFLKHEPKTERDAAALSDVGTEYKNTTLGDPARNLGRAIACYTAALQAYADGRETPQWAGVQNNLGLAYAELPTGNQTENLKRAIGCYTAALRVYTENREPLQWAATQNNLGIAQSNLPAVDRTESLRQAIGYYEAALRVYTDGKETPQWATIQNNLGNTHAKLPTGDLGINLERAIECYKKALRVRTVGNLPQDWATIQNNLGNAYRRLPTGDPGANLRRAIECYKKALRVRTEDRFPVQWATTQNNLGIAYRNLLGVGRARNLRRAIECYQAALRVYTEDRFPQDWAMTQNNLGVAYADLPTGASTGNHERAIECYQAALRVYAESRFPELWAMIQNNLGSAYRNLSAEDLTTRLARANEHYHAALRVYTEDQFPRDWAMTHYNIGLLMEDLASVEQGSGRLWEAFAAVEKAVRGYRACGVSHDLARAEEAFERIRAKLSASPA